MKNDEIQQQNINKKCKARPNFYASCFELLKDLSYNCGYNLIMHGSFNRDLDLIAIPWKDDPVDELKFIQLLDNQLTGNFKDSKEEYMFSILPGGRNSYIIDLFRLDKNNNYEDKQFYLDISITPLLIKNENN